MLVIMETNKRKGQGKELKGNHAARIEERSGKGQRKRRSEGGREREVEGKKRRNGNLVMKGEGKGEERHKLNRWVMKENQKAKVKNSRLIFV